jgi:3-oxoacyl-[acyl-carrier protein] reductase
MDLGLQDRVAVVGASSKGLGRGAAIALAAEGAAVVVNGRGTEAVEETVATIVAAGGRALGVPGDMADPATPGTLVQRAVEVFGRLDIVVGNSGGPAPVKAWDATDEQILDAIEANHLASVRLARAALPHLRANGWGRVCMITSSSVRQPMELLATSSMARTALWSWAKLAAQGVAEEGITVNLICPGGHATARAGTVNSGARLGDPMDFGKAVAFLCSAPAAFINGVALGVDGGSVIGLL